MAQPAEPTKKKAPAPPPIVEQGSSAPAVTDLPPAPPAPASEYYGGETSAVPVEGTPPAESYDYSLANNPQLVETSYPATGKPSTHRYIPPPESTFPADERDRSLPPPPTMQDLQQHYPRAFPDIEPYWAGEGGRDAPPPPPNRRLVPATTANRIFHQYHSGEGAMGQGDPLDPRNDPDTVGARPLVQYRKGPGEATGYTRFRPGYGGREVLESRAAVGGPPAPPPGYVPELIRGSSGTMSTYHEERAPFPSRPQTHPMPPPPIPGTYPQPRGGSPYNDDYAPMSLLEALRVMEKARRERGPRLRGLFGGGEDE